MTSYDMLSMDAVVAAANGTGPRSTMSSESYTRLVERIEAQIKQVKAMGSGDPASTKTKLTELKKQKRALKNKASAMRCREKKRRRMEDLEKSVEDLQAKVLALQEENDRLRLEAGKPLRPREPLKPIVSSSSSTSSTESSSDSVDSTDAPTSGKRTRIHYATPTSAAALPMSSSSSSTTSMTTSSTTTPAPVPVVDTAPMALHTSSTSQRVIKPENSSLKVSPSRTHAVTEGTLSDAELDGFALDMFDGDVSFDMFGAAVSGGAVGSLLPSDLVGDIGGGMMESYTKSAGQGEGVMDAVHSFLHAPSSTGSVRSLVGAL